MGRLLTDSLVVMIVILLTAFLLLKYEANLKEIYAKAVGESTCEASVRTHAALKLRYADFSGDINCPTVKLKIDDKNEEIVKKKVADAMVDCWDQFGRGKLELFKDDSVYCSICHRITFDKEIKFNGFMKYLAEEKLSKQAKGESITYLQYLTTEKTQNSDFLNELANRKIDDTVLASQQNEYAIVFTHVKGKQYLKEYAAKAGNIAPGVGLIIIGVGTFKAGGIVGGAVSAVATPLVGVPVGLTISSAGALLISIGALWGYAAYFIEGVSFEHISLISFIPYDAQYLESLNCKEIPTK